MKATDSGDPSTVREPLRAGTEQADSGDEATFQSLVERVREVAIFMVDEKGIIRSWNVGAAQLTGYRRSEILGQHVSVLYPISADAHAGPAQSWSGAPRPGRFEEEVWLERKDGSRFWADVTFSLISTEDGRPDCFAVVARDRTERREREASQRRLTMILEGTTDFVSFSDPEGRILYINDAGRAMLGIGLHEDISGMTIPDVHPQWATGVILRDGIPATLENGSWSGETALLTRDGREIPVLQVLLAHRTPAGRLEFASTIARDITDRKQAEAAQSFLVEASRCLATSLDYRITLKNLVELVVPRLADWCMVAMLEDDEVHWIAATHREPATSHRLQGLTGGRQPLDLSAPVGVHRVLTSGEPELVPAVSEQWIQAAVRDYSRLEMIRDLAPGSALIVPFLARGQTLGAIAFFSDAELRYRQADRELAEELAGRAALAIDNARLYQAEHEAVSTRDEVLSIVAHDLRNPLSRIIMGTELLLELGADRSDTERRQLEIVGRASTAMNRLIQDLLDVARVESGRPLAIELARYDVASLLAGGCEMVHPQAEEKGLRLDCAPPEEKLTVEVDRDRILQVLGNLLGNAVKFTDRGVITVAADGVAGEVRFSVSDTGPGIAAEDRVHLFDRFWQARKSRRGGAGLGLAISKGIVEAHGGRIWLESEVGAGTTFHFTLPSGRKSEG